MGWDGGCEHSILSLHITTSFPPGSPIKAAHYRRRHHLTTVHGRITLTWTLNEILVWRSLWKSMMCEIWNPHHLQHLVGDEAAFELDCFPSCPRGEQFNGSHWLRSQRPPSYKARVPHLEAFNHWQTFWITHTHTLQLPGKYLLRTERLERFAAERASTIIFPK